MKFVIGTSEKVTKTVSFFKPGDYDKQIKYDFDVTFKLLPVERFKQIQDQADDDPVGDFELMKETLTDIKGVFDEKGEELPFSDELIEMVMNDVHAKMGLMETFFMLHTKQGRKDARRKNY